MSFRFYYASEGYLGWIMEIIREAAIRAIDTGCNSLNMPLLAAGYEARLAGTEVGDGKVNPFSMQGFTQATVDQLKPVPTKKRRGSTPRRMSNKGPRKRKTQERRED